MFFFTFIVFDNCQNIVSFVHSSYSLMHILFSEETTTTHITATAKNSSKTASRDSKIGPGSYYYFDSSHTLPRAQARKYDFPWDSLPKDWTTSVKLREISKRRKEDRQSSSGNLADRKSSFLNALLLLCFLSPML